MQTEQLISQKNPLVRIQQSELLNCKYVVKNVVWVESTAVWVNYENKLN